MLRFAKYNQAFILGHYGYSCKSRIAELTFCLMNDYQHYPESRDWKCWRGWKFILILTSAAYIVQIAADIVLGGSFTAIFALSRAGVRHFFLWQFVTYMFLHGGLFHILFNMLWLYFMGRDIEDVLGTARFVFLYIIAGVLGGLLWLCFAGSIGICFGASGAVFGLIGAFGAIFATRRITLLLYFIPINMTGRTLAICAGAITMLMMFDGGRDGVAHLAHLGGGIAGYVYGSWIKARRGYLFGTEWSRWNPFRGGWISRLFSQMRGGSIRLMDPLPEYIPSQGEVDEILEKVARKGMGMLSRWERQVLDRAAKNGVNKQDLD